MTDVRLAIRERRSRAIVASAPADAVGNFTFVAVPRRPNLEIGWNIPGLFAGFCWAPLPIDVPVGLPLLEACDPGGPVFISVVPTDRSSVGIKEEGIK